jgi:hypothetical protein
VTTLHEEPLPARSLSRVVLPIYDNCHSSSSSNRGGSLIITLYLAHTPCNGSIARLCTKQVVLALLLAFSPDTGKRG